MSYFAKEDILHLMISDEPEADSREIRPNMTAELNEAGELIGLEILEASSFFKLNYLEQVNKSIVMG